MSFQDLRTQGRQGTASPARAGPSQSPSKPTLAQAYGGKTPPNSIRQPYSPSGQPGEHASPSASPPPPPSASALPGSDPDVTRGVFQMNTAVSSFKRLVNSLGTPKDTPELRQKLHKSRQYVTQLGKDIAGKLRDASARDHAAGVSTAKKLSDAKLAKDFQAVLREFEKAQHLAVEREAAYTPASAEPAGKKPAQLQGAAGKRPSLPSGVQNGEGSRDPLLREQQRQELLQVESELAYTEAVIEEREQGIAEIQHQIAEVNEIFRDLAVLVKEQGVMIDDIEANIENAHAQNVQANKQLLKAAKTQKESNSFVCWIMGLFAVGLFIFFLVMTS